MSNLETEDGALVLTGNSLINICLMTLLGRAVRS